MLSPSDFGFTNGPVLITHQAQDGESWRRLKPALRTFAAVGEQRHLANTPRIGKGDQSNFSPRTDLLRQTCVR